MGSLQCILFFSYVVLHIASSDQLGNNITVHHYNRNGPWFNWKAGSCDCGKMNRNHKIVGGQLTEKNEYPWMVSLHWSTQLTKGNFFKSQFCGGSLLSSSWVITAAHCTTDFKTRPTSVTIVLGDYDLAEGLDSTKLHRRVSKIIVHPKYSPLTMDSDISLVKLESPVEFSNIVRPVCMPPITLNVNDKDVIVIGWGATAEDGPSSSKPMEVQVPIIPNNRCRRFYESVGMPITSKMLCAGTGEKDSCQGDSGGPLVTEGQYGQCTIVGVVSFGIGCARPNYPGVYTRVSSFIPWIKQNVGKDICIKS